MKNALILIVLVITQVLGDIWLSRGMKIYGEITSYSPQAIWQLITYLCTSFWIVLAVATLAFSWFLYLISVSRMDLSYVLPIHASSYILNGLMAWLILDEILSPRRWIATIIIAIGVFLVGWSEYLRQKKHQKQVKILNISDQKVNSVLLFLPLSINLSKVWLGVLLLVCADSMGDLLTAKGMKKVGSISSFSRQSFLNWIKKIVTNISVLGGILSQAIGLLMFISLLSWDDISLVRPATALGYIMNLFGAKYILKETINKNRLLGIVVIGCGIILISFS